MFVVVGAFPTVIQGRRGRRKTRTLLSACRPRAGKWGKRIAGKGMVYARCATTEFVAMRLGGRGRCGPPVESHGPRHHPLRGRCRGTADRKGNTQGSRHHIMDSPVPTFPCPKFPCPRHRRRPFPRPSFTDLWHRPGYPCPNALLCGPRQHAANGSKTLLRNHPLRE